MITDLYCETTCIGISLSRFNKLMANSRSCSYNHLKQLIKCHLPGLYHDLMLDLYNPWCDQCLQTKTHYILIHSGIEFFLRKVR